MKTYIFTKTEKRSNYATNVTCTIYRVKNNLPIYVGECKYNTGSTKGAESEVLDVLVKLKEIPASYLKLSKNDWRGAGYYCHEVVDKGVTIKGL